MGSCVPWHIIAAALAPHCWNATSFADPEYVMDLGSPSAFCALAMTVFASCATAFAERHVKQIATSASLFTTATPPSMSRETRARWRLRTRPHTRWHDWPSARPPIEPSVASPPSPRPGEYVATRTARATLPVHAGRRESDDSTPRPD